MQASDKLKKWLKETLKQDVHLTAIPGDASKRYYFRVLTTDKQAVAVDASLEPEMNRKFIRVTELFRRYQINVPEIIAQNDEDNFLIISDFGDTLFQEAVKTQPKTKLYHDALKSLIEIHKVDASELPNFSDQLLQDEMNFFHDWYLQQHLNIELTAEEQECWKATCSYLIQSAIEQPQVCVHRDYHCRNLFFTQHNNPGIIDYQDAVQGPLTYDAVSLLRDCYIEWCPEQIESWLSEYIKDLQQTSLIDNSEIETFKTWFDLMGMQRHLKAIGIFARLSVRDNKPQYLQSIPRTLNYIYEVCHHYPALSSFKQIIEKHLLDPVQQQAKTATH